MATIILTQRKQHTITVRPKLRKNKQARSAAMVIITAPTTAFQNTCLPTSRNFRNLHVYLIPAIFGELLWPEIDNLSSRANANSSKTIR